MNIILMRGVHFCTLAVGQPSVVVGTRTATSISLSWSIPSDLAVTSYEVMWQRDTSVGCPNKDEGSASTSSTSYDIMGLEEDSRYSLTVLAPNDASSSAVSNAVTVMTDEAGTSYNLVYIALGLQLILYCSSLDSAYFSQYY